MSHDSLTLDRKILLLTFLGKGYYIILSNDVRKGGNLANRSDIGKPKLMDQIRPATWKLRMVFTFLHDYIFDWAVKLRTHDPFTLYWLIISIVK